MTAPAPPSSATGSSTRSTTRSTPTTGTVKLRAIFDNAEQILFPNQFVNIQLLVDTLHDSDIVPAAAIQRGAPGTFVYLVKPDETVAVRPVKLGPSDGQRVAVLDGLQPGEQVVVDGADRLRDGAKVTVARRPADRQAPASRKPRPDRRGGAGIGAAATRSANRAPAAGRTARAERPTHAAMTRLKQCSARAWRASPHHRLR